MAQTTTTPTRASTRARKRKAAEPNADDSDVQIIAVVPKSTPTPARNNVKAKGRTFTPTTPATPVNAPNIDLAHAGPSSVSSKKAKRSTFAGLAPRTPEKRPKRYRDRPSNAVQERLYRCQTQKMFVVDRKRGERDPLEEVFKLAGSTGNIYTVTICDVPHCDCPDGFRSGTCKHILYIMSKVLRAGESLVYQAGLLRSELEHIFANAPPPPSSDDNQGRRKPVGEDDCPICYEHIKATENIVWCGAQCGTNIHAQCFNSWKASKSGETVTCVMCRQPWQSTDSLQLKEKLKNAQAEVGEDGYVNMADELGISKVRDTSTYRSPYRRGYRARYYRYSDEDDNDYYLY